MNETIHFKKQRELGTIITDTFKFLRTHGKPLFGLILKITGPALLIMILAYAYYVQYLSASLVWTDDAQNPLEALPPLAYVSMGLLLMAAVVYYSLLNGVVMHYIKAYIHNKDKVDLEAVSDGVRNDFWKLIGTSIVIGTLTGVGMMLCVVPGIYIGVVLAPIYAVVVFERKDVMDAFSACFKLIKNEWWMTFATLIVVFMLYYIIVMVFQIPQYIYFFIKGVSMTEIITTDPAAMFDWVYILLTSISMIFQYLLHTIVVMAVAFIYFHLNEKKHFTGTMEAIDSIGDER